MSHFQDILLQHDAETARILVSQVLDERSPHLGAMVLPDHQIDTRTMGFWLAHICVSYVNPASRYFHDDTVANALLLGVGYMLSHLRPGGCVDLTNCNFASAPDTSFMLNEIICAWWLLEKDRSAGAESLRGPLRALIETCAEGVMNGGFHTPNHRWAISACLKHAAKIAGREDFSRRADVYLGEGLDINEDGEFAERSAGNYNQVNDDQMIRLYLATGDRTFLEAARSNLLMMLNYIDPDGSVFTYNSTRQDYGTKVYLQSYYILFLLTGYLLKDPALAAWAEVCWDLSAGHGALPGGLEWLLLFPDMEDFARREKADLDRVERYDRLFAASNIARIRRGDFSCTVMAGRPNFLYFQHGANMMVLSLYGNVCDVRNFIPRAIEKTETGYRLLAHVDSWYYLPFDGDKPATSDWWAMDNAATRRRLITDALDTVVDVSLAADGVDVRVRTEGLTGVPFRFEFGFTPVGEVRGEGFITAGTPGGQITVCGGRLQAGAMPGETITLSPCFASHNRSSRMGGAYPMNAGLFNVWLSAHTPFDRTIHIGTDPVFPLTLE